MRLYYAENCAGAPPHRNRILFLYYNFKTFFNIELVCSILTLCPHLYISVQSNDHIGDNMVQLNDYILNHIARALQYYQI